MCQETIFSQAEEEGGFSHEGKKGDAKGKAGKNEAGSVGMGVGTANPTFFPRPDTAIKRCNGSETSKLHTV